MPNLATVSRTQRSTPALRLLTRLGLTLAVAGSLAACSKAKDSSYTHSPDSVAYGAPADYTPGNQEQAGADQDYAMTDDEALEGEADAEEAPMAAPEPAMEMDIAQARPSKADRRTARKERKRNKAKKNRGKNTAYKTAPGTPQAVGGAALAPVAVPPPEPEFNTEGYEHIEENEFLAVADKPLSTFSIDVDTASYSNSRRFLNSGSLPPADAVRIEEMINYFEYDYKSPIGKTPFSVTTEVGECPWNDDAQLVHIGIQGKKVDSSEVPARNLVFLLDVSGSMNNHDKLPLLKQGLTMLVNDLRPQDHVSIVVYAGASGVVLKPTSGRDKNQIVDALTRLEAGGSTNGGEGIELAYKMAQKNFKRGAINRVILATDGDFNVGATSEGALTRLIERKRKSGVFLSVLGFGTGNVKDSTMELLADKGNGNYAYIDSQREAHKVLVEQAGSTLMTIAKDVKLQVEFNPSEVAAYRLVGYENRKLADRDFNDDTKDAGEIGAGHTVTALYEVVPTSRAQGKKQVDPLVYQKDTGLTNRAGSGELANVKIRYKQPSGSKSKLLTFPVDAETAARASDNFLFSASVAEFAMLLRGSKFSGTATFGDAYKMAKSSIGHDRNGYRKEFLGLIKQAASLKGETVTKASKKVTQLAK